MQKLKLTIILFTTLLLSACGGVSTNPTETIKNVNEFNKKAAIFIIKGVSTGICESPLFRNPLSEALTGVITQERPSSVSCNDYGRTNSRTTGCYKEDYIRPGNLACIIGYDGVKNNNGNTNVLNALITGTIISIFIGLAE